MATLNEIIYILKNEINDYSAEYKVSNRQFEFMVNYVRSTLIKRDHDKGKSLSSNVIQNLGPVPMGRVNKSGEPANTLAGEILTTVSTIPHPLECNAKDLITYVGGTDRESPFDFSNRSYAAHWAKYNAYTSGLKKSFYRDGRIYVTGDKSLAIKQLWIEGVFEDPRDVYNFKIANHGSVPPIDYAELPYPMSEYMIEAMTAMIKKGELDMKLTIARDNVNNGADAKPNETVNTNGYGMGGMNNGYGNQGYGRGGQGGYY